MQDSGLTEELGIQTNILASFISKGTVTYSCCFFFITVLLESPIKDQGPIL